MKKLCTLAVLGTLLVGCEQGSGGGSSESKSVSGNKDSSQLDSTIPSGMKRVVFHAEATSLKSFVNDGSGTYSEVDSEALTDIIKLHYTNNLLFIAREVGTSASLSVYDVASDGSISLKKSLGSYSNYKAVAFSPDGSKYYVSNNTGVIHQRSYNIGTNTFTSDFNKDYGTQVDRLHATNEGVWGVAGSKILRSAETSATFADRGVLVEANDVLTSVIIGNDSVSYRATGRNLEAYMQTDISLSSQVDATTSFATQADEFTSLYHNGTKLFTTDDNNEMTIYESDLSSPETYSICTGGKITNIANNIVSVNCNDQLKAYHYTGSDVEEIDSVDSGVNVNTTIAVHI